MRVTVTGGSGFIGTHVLGALALQGHEATNLDRNAASPCEMEECREDDFAGAESVIHLAAHADVRDNWLPGHVEAIVLDNQIALNAVLEAASRIQSIKSFVFVSTGAVYADQMSPYAASKLSGEAWCKAYADKFGWRLSIVRPAACYGSGYHHGHVADFVRMAKEMGRVKALTRGDPRDALRVEDLAEMLAAFAINGPPRPGPLYMRSPERWGCRDTVSLMGVEAEWSDSSHGWIGDASKSTFSLFYNPSDDGIDAGIGSTPRAIGPGVRDALRSLGWEPR